MGTDLSYYSVWLAGMSYGKAADWMDSTGKEVDIWETMINRSGEWIDATVQLRTSMASQLK